MPWNWESENRPKFTYSAEKIPRYEKVFLHKAGILLGSFQHVYEGDPANSAVHALVNLLRLSLPIPTKPHKPLVNLPLVDVEPRFLYYKYYEQPLISIQFLSIKKASRISLLAYVGVAGL
jgi:hypothetical protein